MRLHFIAIPALDGEAAEEELNGFLASHRVVSIDRQLVVDGARSYWAVCVAWIVGGKREGAASNPKARVDYRETLSPEQFAVFARLRELRRKLAEAEGVPSYAVFTNEQLAEMVRRGAKSAAELGRIEGIGAARVEKYSEAVLAILKALPSAEASAAPKA